MRKKSADTSVAESTEKSSTMLLSKEQIAQYKSLFNLIDQDHDGKISSKDLKTTIVSQGIESVDDDSIMLMMKKGDIGMTSFLRLMANRYGGFSDSEDLNDAFAVFKDDDPKELKKSLLEVGRGDEEFEISEHQIDRVFRDFCKENKVTGEQTFMSEKFVEATR